MSTNKNLHNAKTNINDEFYTRIEDVENELKHYSFKNMIVYCPCDTKDSAFFKYFHDNFFELGIKKVICTSYNANGNGVYIQYDGDIYLEHYMRENGDFRSKECEDIMKTCNIVVTNPPFSLFRDFVAMMDKLAMKYIVIGTENSAIYKDYFKDIINGKAHIGYNLVKSFASQNGETIHFGNICWWTNVQGDEEKPFLKLKDNVKDFIHYDNYSAIEIGKVDEIPSNYNGAIGVPITFLKYHNERQFEILGLTSSSKENGGVCYDGYSSTRAMVNGKYKYARLLIKKRA